MNLKKEGQGNGPPKSAGGGCISVESRLPDLRKKMPAVRSKVLQGVRLVFSEVVPRQVNLRESKAYVATSLGATVGEKVVVQDEAGPPVTPSGSQQVHGKSPCCTKGQIRQASSEMTSWPWQQDLKQQSISWVP